MNPVDARDGMVEDADRAIHAMRTRFEEERVELWRWKVRLQLRRASTLCLAVLAREDLRLVDLLPLMWPPASWPDTAGLFRPYLEPLLRDDQDGRTFGGLRKDRAFERRLSQEGCVIRLPSSDDGRLGVSVRGGDLTVCVDLGPCRLIATTGGALLRLPQGTPETAVAACVGRHVTDMVDHPLLRLGDHVIRRVRTAGASMAAVLSLSDATVTLTPEDLGLDCAPARAADGTSATVRERVLLPEASFYSTPQAAF